MFVCDIVEGQAKYWQAKVWFLLIHNKLNNTIFDKQDFSLGPKIMLVEVSLQFSETS